MLTKLDKAERNLREKVAVLYKQDEMELDAFMDIQDSLVDTFNELRDDVLESRNMSELVYKAGENIDKGDIVRISREEMEKRSYNLNPNHVIKNKIHLNKIGIWNMIYHIKQLMGNKKRMTSKIRKEIAKKFNVSEITVYRRYSEYRNKKGKGWEAYQSQQKFVI